MKFDLVMGNPPYQAPTNTEKGNTQGGLWFKFLEKSMGLVSLNGFIVFVSPKSWTGIGGFKTKAFKFNMFKKFDVVDIDFDASRYFPGIGIDICSYTLRNSKTEMETKVVSKGVSFNVNLHNVQVLPYLVSPETISIVNKILNTNGSYSYNFKEGFDKNSGNTKVYIISSRFGSIKNIRFDWTGETSDKWGISMLISDKDVGAESLFRSKLFSFYFKAVGGEAGMSQTGIMQNAPYVDLTRSWTDQELYAHFNLTQEEIDYIEAQVK